MEDHFSEENDPKSKNKKNYTVIVNITFFIQKHIKI
jgi:hypothetical protein